jgi:hypothetical protein
LGGRHSESQDEDVPVWDPGAAGAAD